MKVYMKVSMLRWLIYWGKLVDGIVGILTLGMVNAGVSLKLAKAYSKHRFMGLRMKEYDRE